MTRKDQLAELNGETWEFDGSYDPTSFFRALDLFSDANLAIYIEGTSIDKGVLKTLDQYSTNKQPLVKSGTSWPESDKLHLTLTPSLVDELIRISETHAVPEYADHVVIYGDEVVLEAYDFASSPYRIAGQFEEALIVKFSTISKSKYKNVKI